MDDKTFINKCHELIHSLRLIDGYKPSKAEIKLSRWVIEKFSDSCDDCKEAKKRIEEAEKNKPKQSFFGSLLNGLNNKDGGQND